MKRIIIVDDESSSRAILKKIISDAGYSVTLASGGEEALKKISASRFDVMLTDLNMPLMNGIELTEKVLQIEPDMIVILITAYGSIRTAVEAIRLGAFDFLSKPVNKDELLLIISRGIEKATLLKENLLLSRELKRTKNVPVLISDNDKMKGIMENAKQIALADSAILITGEPGTEKQELARFIHNNSQGAKYEFISLDCNTLSDDSFESELFGHIKGYSKKFISANKGYLEIAEKGTIFINEISKLSSYVQLKLLRVLNEKQFSKLGENKLNISNARIIVSSSEGLEKLVYERKFNENLYNKLKLFEINIPPLKERPEDILFFFNKFVEEIAYSKNLTVKEISPDVTRMIINYMWPGNLSELKDTAERVVILCTDGVIRKELFPENILEVEQYKDLFANSSYKANKAKAVNDFEVNFIKKYLKLCKGNISEVGRVIGFHQISLRQKIAKLGINPKEFSVKK
ncbi:MAG: sigma-54-dependent Fis family transcriptional regulator [Ignavibacteriae bacterium]|nr:sigma-54-dependent Fis family transcriptional regulator [Ignavibacteriota bacterium]